ncbi:MAG: 50S ribosomal protein L11 methyltransferase [bacterium]|nr:MAG: 50S ribosomal protein L11 methyltransferase [bacterium]
MRRKRKPGISLIDIGRKWLPFEVGSRYYIKPDSFNEQKNGKINITLGPGRAFGSGEHETTRHCLELMETLKFSCHHKILDYGTGTGILSIAAAKLNAGFVLALDNEFNAILTCKNNIQLNHIDKEIVVVCGDLSCINPHYQFHIILANLYSDIILERSLLLTKHLKKDGYVLLSGIDWDYQDDVKRRFSQLNYQIVKQRTGNDYNSIIYRKIFD